MSNQSSYPSARITLIDSEGPWSSHLISDINHARSILEDHGHAPLILTQFLGYYTPVEIRISSKLITASENLISQTHVSYRQFLEKNSIATIIADDSIEDTIALVSYENDTVQINDIEVQSSPTTTIKEEN